MRVGAGPPRGAGPSGGWTKVQGPRGQGQVSWTTSPGCSDATGKVRPPQGTASQLPVCVCVRVSVCSRLSYRRTLVLTTRVCMPVSCVGGTCRVSEGLWVGCVHTTCVRDPSPGLSHDEVCPLLNGRHCAETGSRVP